VVKHEVASGRGRPSYTFRMTVAPALLILAAALTAAPADEWAARRNPSSTWAGVAWGEFRFGMGPGDVAQIVERGGAPEWKGSFMKREGRTALTVSDELVVQGSRVRLAGAFGTVVFAFYQGLLYQVRFTADSDSFEGEDTRATGRPSSPRRPTPGASATSRSRRRAASRRSGSPAGRSATR
jgi:hypothetical protein